MRPCASVSGTRCTRWPPDSNLSFANTPLPDDARDDLAESAEIGRRFGHHLHLPALALGVARVHAEQVAGEERRLVAAGARADLQEDVALVVRIARQQHRLQLAADAREPFLGALPLLFRERLHLRIVGQLGGRRQVGLRTRVIAEARDDGIDLRVLARHRAIAVHVARRVLRGEQMVELTQADGELVELGAKRRFHWSGTNVGLCEADAYRTSSPRKRGPSVVLARKPLGPRLARGRRSSIVSLRLAGRRVGQVVDALQQRDQLRALGLAGGVERLRAARAAACW